MPVPSDCMLMDEQVWQENAYLVKLLLTCGLSGGQLVPKLDSFAILISWIEVCTSDTAYIMLQVNNWEKSEFCLDFVDSISKETDCPTPCQRALAACWLSPRDSSSLAFLKAIHAECLCQLVHVHNPSAGDLFDTWATEQPKIQDIKNWLSMEVVFAFYVILSYFYSLKSD